MFNALLSKLGLQPKNLLEAGEAQAAAKTFADSVNTLFANAGLSLEQMLQAGPDALKAHNDALIAAKPVEDKSAQIAELQASVEKVTALNTALESKVAALKADADKLTAFNAALADVGIKCENPEGLAAALKGRVSIRARELVAATGGPILDESPVADASKPAESPAEPKLFGLARVSAAFKRQSEAARYKGN